MSQAYTQQQFSLLQKHYANDFFFSEDIVAVFDAYLDELAERNEISAEYYEQMRNFKTDFKHEIEDFLAEIRELKISQIEHELLLLNISALFAADLLYTFLISHKGMIHYFFTPFQQTPEKERILRSYVYKCVAYHQSTGVFESILAFKNNASPSLQRKIANGIEGFYNLLLEYGQLTLINTPIIFSTDTLHHSLQALGQIYSLREKGLKRTSEKLHYHLPHWASFFLMPAFALFKEQKTLDRIINDSIKSFRNQALGLSQN